MDSPASERRAIGLGLKADAGRSTTLFLDFDGVLHPYGCLARHHFVTLPLLGEVLRNRPWVEVVVASDWRLSTPSGEVRDWDLKPIEAIRGWLAPEPSVEVRLAGVTPIRPDLTRLPDRVLGYEREAQCLAWLRAWRPGRSQWIALDDSEWLFSPFCPQLFVVDRKTGLLPEQLVDLGRRLDLSRI
jgi:hypothetical protein